MNQNPTRPEHRLTTPGPQDSAAHALPARPASTTWIPRVVRCARCEELAREEARERLTDDEVAVRYGCAACRWHQTRHYYETDR